MPGPTRNVTPQRNSDIHRNDETTNNQQVHARRQHEQMNEVTHTAESGKAVNAVINQNQQPVSSQAPRQGNRRRRKRCRNGPNKDIVEITGDRQNTSGSHHGNVQHQVTNLDPNDHQLHNGHTLVNGTSNGVEVSSTGERGSDALCMVAAGVGQAEDHQSCNDQKAAENRRSSKKSKRNRWRSREGQMHQQTKNEPVSTPDMRLRLHSGDNSHNQYPIYCQASDRNRSSPAENDCRTVNHATPASQELTAQTSRQEVAFAAAATSSRQTDVTSVAQHASCDSRRKNDEVKRRVGCTTNAKSKDAAVADAISSSLSRDSEASTVKAITGGSVLSSISYASVAKAAGVDTPSQTTRVTQTNRQTPANITRKTTANQQFSAASIANGRPDRRRVNGMTVDYRSATSDWQSGSTTINDSPARFENRGRGTPNKMKPARFSGSKQDQRRPQYNDGRNTAMSSGNGTRRDSRYNRNVSRSLVASPNLLKSDCGNKSRRVRRCSGLNIPPLDHDVSLDGHEAQERYRAFLEHNASMFNIELNFQSHQSLVPTALDQTSTLDQSDPLFVQSPIQFHHRHGLPYNPLNQVQPMVWAADQFATYFPCGVNLASPEQPVSRADRQPRQRLSDDVADDAPSMDQFPPLASSPQRQSDFIIPTTNNNNNDNNSDNDNNNNDNNNNQQQQQPLEHDGDKCRPKLPLQRRPLTWNEETSSANLVANSFVATPSNRENMEQDSNKISLDGLIISSTEFQRNDAHMPEYNEAIAWGQSFQQPEQPLQTSNRYEGEDEPMTKYNGVHSQGAEQWQNPEPDRSSYFRMIVVPRKMALSPQQLTRVRFLEINDVQHIFVHLECSNSSDQLRGLTDEMNNHYDSITFIYNQFLTVGSICACRIDDIGWCRTVVRHIAVEEPASASSSTIVVQLLDHGGYRNVDRDRLEPLQAAFMCLPFQAIEVFLEGIAPNMDVESKKRREVAKSYLQGQQFLAAKAVGYTKDASYVVELYNCLDNELAGKVTNDFIRIGVAVPVYPPAMSMPPTPDMSHEASECDRTDLTQEPLAAGDATSPTNTVGRLRSCQSASPNMTSEATSTFGDEVLMTLEDTYRPELGLCNAQYNEQGTGARSSDHGRATTDTPASSLAGSTDEAGSAVFSSTSSTVGRAGSSPLDEQSTAARVAKALEWQESVC